MVSPLRLSERLTRTSSAPDRRRRWVHQLLVGVAAAPLTVVPVGTASAEELITIASGFSVTLPPAASAEVVVPFTVVGMNERPITSDVLFITRGGVQLTDPKVRAAVDLAHRVLKITVGEGALERAGTYVVTLRLTRAAATQSLDVSIVRSVAALTIPPTIKVKRTVGFPEVGWLDWPFGEGNDKPALSIPVGADGRLTRLSANQTEAASGSIRMSVKCVAPPPGRETCPLDADEETVLASPIGPNGSLVVDYELDDRFPLGTVTRTVTLRSSELAAPQTVTFEIRTRRSQAIIVVLVAVGLLAGWLLRGLIQRLLGLIGALRDRDDLLLQLTAVHDDYEDAELREQLGERIIRLRNASWTKVASTVAEVRSQANERLKALTTALAAVKTRHDELRPVLAGDWRVPAPVRPNLAIARSKMRSIGERHAAHDAQRAGDMVVELDKVVLPELRQAAKNWLLAYAASLDDLVTSAAADSGITRAAAQAKADLQTDATEDSGIWLRRLSLAMAGWAPVRIGILARLDQPGTDQEKAQAIRAQLPTNDPDPHAAITAVLPDLSALLAEDKTLGDEEPPAAAGARARAAAEEEETPYIPTLPPTAEELRRQLAGRALRGATRFVVLVARFVILMALLVILALGLFGDSWVGTAKDMITLLFWAFATDVTIEALTTAASGLSKPATASSQSR